MKQRIKVGIAATVLLSSMQALATPVLQTHIQGATAMDLSGSDEQTWVLETPPNTEFYLDLMGNFGEKVKAIENAYLVITTADGANLSLDMALPITTGAGLDDGTGGYYPFQSVDLSGRLFDDSNAFEAALGSGVSFNNHAPYGGAADKIDIYGISLNELGFEFDQSAFGDTFGVFSGLQVVPDCNADPASRTNPDPTACDSGNASQLGEIKAVGMLADGADWLHVDMVAQVTTKQGKKKYVTTWDINPGSHDSTWTVPEPSSVLLMGLGLLGVGFLVRRRSS